MALENAFKTGPAFKNSFNVESFGLVQGDAQDDPAVRLLLAAGVLADDVVGSMWGGMGIIESVPKSSEAMLGAVIRQATATSCNGFMVMNQANHGVVTPNNGVPQFMAGNGVHYYRLGTGARIPLPISAAVAALANGTTSTTSTQFKWDPAAQVIDVATTGGISIRLLKVSPAGNMAAVQDATTKDVNWEDKPMGLFSI